MKPKQFEVTTNQGRLKFSLCCPGCGNRDWDKIPDFPQWRKCHFCDVQVKAEHTKNRFLQLIVLTEDRVDVFRSEEE
jgi:hypothetical protein